jgi:hypothetical protein
MFIPFTLEEVRSPSLFILYHTGIRFAQNVTEAHTQPRASQTASANANAFGRQAPSGITLTQFRSTPGL